MPPPERASFDIPEGLAYINCAYLSPLMNSVVDVGRQAVLRKARPWTIRHDDFFAEVETLRACFATLIDADPADVAIVNSTSYGIATAAMNTAFSAGDNIVIPRSEHASTFHKWRAEAEARSAELREVEADAGGGWTDAIIARIDERTRVVSVPNVHWADGCLFDLKKIGECARAVGAAFVIDGTQSIGALPLSVRALAPDYLTCSAYKWLLCPYGLAFLYVAPHRQEGRPLEDHYFHRLNAAGHEGHLDHVNAYAPGARRFDMGERSNFIILPMAVTALRQLLDWSVPEIGRRIGLIAASILAGAASLGYHAASTDRQATHLFGLRRRGGLPADLAVRLHAANVFVSIRGDAIRVSPHVYNTEADVSQFLAALRACGQ
jgi:selenocysteine lyase/cysteine desulfurase